MRCCLLLLTCFLLGACVREETARKDILRVDVEEGYLKRYGTYQKKIIPTKSAGEILFKSLFLGGNFWDCIEEQDDLKTIQKNAETQINRLSIVFVDPNNTWNRVALRFDPGKTDLLNNDHIRALCKNPSVQLEFISKEDPILHHSFLWSPPPILDSINLHFTSDGFLVVNGERLTPKACAP